MQSVTFRLQGDRLTHGTTARPLTAQDHERFAAWNRTYHALAWQPHNHPGLLALGREIAAWLDGDEAWLAALRAQGDAPVLAEFAVSGSPSEQDRQFLEVPWELAATGDTFLAADPGMLWAPLRRIGAVGTRPEPNPTNRLGVLFMAAAPFGQTELDIEAEEVAILRATAELGMDLQVEDTGTLAELTRAWQAARNLDVLHLSCHGMGGATPFLALEDAVGALSRTTLDDLAGGFIEGKPRLLFLSACHTGQGGETVDSLARALVRVGFPAVLGWADSVFDRDATAFAAAFYRRLARPGGSIQAAWAGARYDLLRQPHPPAHWHLARLFLGPTGGGALAAGTKARGRTDPDAGRKGVLEAPGRQIEVASRFEFVGRRRQLQAIERAFRGRTHAGVAILGLGRQGKSSLAARVLDRHPHLTMVALFRACDGPTLLAEFSRKIAGAGELCAGFRDRVDPHQAARYDPDALYHALRALLDGPCGHRSAGGKPVLLLLDDFEALLDPPSGPLDLARVQPEAAAALAAVIRAFSDADTESRLLLTSRYAFRLPDRGHDLADRLLRVELPAMSPADSAKQARQKLAASGQDADDPDWFAGFQPRATAAARGNAGLQDLLFRAALTDRTAGEAATAALEAHLTDGAMPERQDLRDTLEGLAIGRLLGWLTPGEQHLLRASTLFRLPVPLSVWRAYAAQAGLEPPDRLFAFGLWERLPDLVDPHADAAAPNAIAAARLLQTSEGPRELAVKQAMLPMLFRTWTHATQASWAATPAIELTRVALDCGNLDVLAATAAAAIQAYVNAYAYHRAATTAKATLAAVSAGKQPVDLHLLRAAVEALDLVGDAEALRAVYATAPSLVIDSPALPESERIARAQFRLRLGEWLSVQGKQDAALIEMQAALLVFEALNDRRMRAMALRDIGRIKGLLGRVDSALEHLQAALEEFAFGDLSERALTLTEIGRVRVNMGNLALGITLHREAHRLYTMCGNQDGIANSDFDIGQILRYEAMKERDTAIMAQAHSVLEEGYRISLEHGRLDAICAIGEQLGYTLVAREMLKEARIVIQTSLDGYRKLGWPGEAERMEALLRKLGLGRD